VGSAAPEREVSEDAALWIAFAHAPGIGPATAAALLRRFGTVENVFAAGRGELGSVPRLRPETRRAFLRPDALVRRASRLAHELAANDIRVVPLADPAYPPPLLDLDDPPVVLYVRGELPEPRGRLFSVAGSTAPSARGLEIARLAGRELVRAGWTVVSGYARGVDAAAHLGSLEADGRTLLILPMGVRAFSLRAEFGAFESEVGRRIVLVSERPPDEPWSARAAVLRDRIIAALGQALLAVEARPQGGTMITFRHALRLGKPAYVVRYCRPPRGAAGNRLAIRAGGIPVESRRALRKIARAATPPRTAPRTRQSELF